MSLLSMCTAPSCTSTGTSPRGLMPRNHGWKFSLANRSIGCDCHVMPLRLRKMRSFCEHDEPMKCKHVHALPVEHLAGLDVAVDELNHETPLRFSRPS